MKKALLMKSLLLLFALVVGTGSSWATAYISYNGNTQDTNTTISGSNVSSGSAGRISWTGTGCSYGSSRVNIDANGSITFTASSGYNITKIVITSGSSSAYYGTWTSTPSVTPSSSSGVTTFDGLNANSVTVTTSTAFRCTSGSNIKIYYAAAGTPTCVAPTFLPVAGTYISAQTVTISTTTEGATIHYTTDGSEPTATSTTYDSNNKPSISTTTTIKAIAVKNGYDNSTVASATYTFVSVEHAGTQTDPYTVADARKAIDAIDGTKENVYVKGIVCTEGSGIGGGSLNYWISDDGTETDKMQSYRGKNLNNTNFTANSDVKVGEIVTIKGTIQKYNNTTYQLATGNYLVDHKKKPATPTFSPAAGSYTSAQNVTISSTEGATIHYTMGDNPATPTSSSTTYSSPINVSANTTIKAIAIKDGVSSDVATAAYTIVTDPFVTVSTNSIDATAAGAVDAITITTGNLTNVAISVVYYESDGTTPATYDHSWIDTDYDNGELAYMVDENTVNAARTAYFKVCATGSEGVAYSELITLTQASANYAELPFSWAGGTRDELTDLQGVSESGLGSDYAAGNAPYRLKMDTKDDYIQIKTNAQIGKVSFGVKMIGGNNESKIKVQESTDGSTFTDVEEFTISGSQNDILNFVTSNALNALSRYVRITKSKHGSNIGVGPISIAEPGEPALPLVSGTTVTLTTTANMAGWRSFDNNTSKKYTVDGTTKVYYASSTGDSKVTLTEIAGGVPANTTVILHQTNGTEITLTETSDAITAPASNLLAVSTANQNLGKVYRLGYKSTNGVGFYTYTTTSAPAGIIYISSVSSAREYLEFAFEDEDVTAIEAVKAQKADGQFYNLSGQRVAQPAKGLYIVNGKKVIIK